MSWTRITASLLLYIVIVANRTLMADNGGWFDLLWNPVIVLHCIVEPVSLFEHVLKLRG